MKVPFKFHSVIAVFVATLATSQAQIVLAVDLNTGASPTLLDFTATTITNFPAKGIDRSNGQYAVTLLASTDEAVSIDQAYSAPTARRPSSSASATRGVGSQSKASAA